RRAGTDIEIAITGVRPGEKLVEELRASDEVQHDTVHPAISRIEPAVLAAEQLDAGMLELDRLVADLDAPAVRTALFGLVGAVVDAGARYEPQPRDLVLPLFD